MLLQNNATPILTTEEFETTDFSIDENNIHVVMDILTNRMYRFKARSIVREYAANAQDAHWDAGLDYLPIRITLPTSTSPVLVIRDYGKGMSVTEIQNIFTKFGASTKRETNNAIGALGMGCKSAFCMTKSFQVIVYRDCEKRNYVVAKNEKGVPQLNYLGATAQTKADPDGMSIEIPVQKNHLHEFASEMDLFSYWDPRPIVINGTIPEPKIAETSEVNIEGMGKIKYHILERPQTPTYHHSDSSRHQTQVVMGGVPYETSADSFNDSEVEEFYGNNGSMAIEVPIGAVEVTASRESLEYTPRTIANLTKIANGIIKIAADKIVEEIDKHKSFLDAAKYYDNLKGSLQSGIKERLQKHAPAYKGMRLNVHQSPPKGDCTLYKFTWFSSWRSIERVKTSKEQARSISFKESEYYYLETESLDSNQLPTTSPTIYKRVKQRLAAMNSDTATVYLLAGTTKEVDETLGNHELWGSLDIANVKDIELPKPIKGQKSNGDSYETVTGLAFKLNHYGNSKLEMFEDPKEDEVLDKEDHTRQVVYIPIHSKKPYIVEPGDWDMDSFKDSILNHRDVINLDTEHGNKEFWVLSKRLLSKVPSHWQSWHEWRDYIPNRLLVMKDELENAKVEQRIRKNYDLPKTLELLGTFMHGNKNWFMEKVLDLEPLKFLRKYFQLEDSDPDSAHPEGSALLEWYNNWSNSATMLKIHPKFEFYDAVEAKLTLMEDRLAKVLEQHPSIYPLLTSQQNYSCKMDKVTMGKAITLIKNSLS